MNNVKQYKRFWEIDLLRSIAVILMIWFHWLFLANYFQVYEINFNYYNDIILPRTVEIIFITLVGVSLYISYIRNKNLLTLYQLRKKFFLRGLKIFGLGLIITFFSYFIDSRYVIIFGILQFIGVSIIIGYFFVNKKILNLILGIVIIIIGLIISNFYLDANYLMIFGFVTSSYATFDYFPFLPWFGYVLIGIYLGQVFYKNNHRQFNLIDLSKNKIINLFCFLGRHSLTIYFVHFPIILMILVSIMRFRGKI